MKLDQYQKKTALYDLGHSNVGAVMTQKSLNIPEFIDKVLGLVGESGEFADKTKKIIRDKLGRFNDEDRAELLKELGDVLWYVAEVSLYLDTSLSDLAKMNLDKLASRKKRGKIEGAGDNR